VRGLNAAIRASSLGGSGGGRDHRVGGGEIGLGGGIGRIYLLFIR
jgi:hypothetical protein